jgi:glutamine amidotransferase
MAGLFGLAAAQPVDVHLSMKHAPAYFQSRGENNPDGWGLGWFDLGGQARVVRHPLPASGEIPEGAASAEACGSVIVAHVRRSSRAPRAQRNTHPFLSNGWLFAHSGALYPLLETRVRRETGRVRCEGQTDSEAFFGLLLRGLEAPVGPVEAIRSAVTLAIEDGQFSGLNFILARAGELYAFRYATRSGSYFSLFWERREPGQPLETHSPETQALIRSAGLAHVPAVVVFSERISEATQPLEMGQLLIVRTAPDLAAEVISLI